MGCGSPKVSKQTFSPKLNSYLGFNSGFRGDKKLRGQGLIDIALQDQREGLHESLQYHKRNRREVCASSRIEGNKAGKSFESTDIPL